MNEPIKPVAMVCPKCTREFYAATDDFVSCPHCGWLEGDAMPIPDGSRIERLVIALIGSPNVKPFEHPQGTPYFAVRVVMLAVHINEEIKKVESGVTPAVPKSRVADKVEWPSDE